MHRQLVVYGWMQNCFTVLLAGGVVAGGVVTGLVYTLTDSMCIAMVTKVANGCFIIVYCINAFAKTHSLLQYYRLGDQHNQFSRKIAILSIP